MTLDSLRETLGDFAKDCSLNVSKFNNPDEFPGLSQKQVFQVAIACAFATKHQALATAILETAGEHLDTQDITAAKSAASIMAMNNVYYRFIHTMDSESYQTLTANLRMRVIAKPGIEKRDFECMSMAISAINGCGLCMQSHEQHLIQSGMTPQGVQSTVRIAAIIQSAELSLSLS